MRATPPVAAAAANINCKNTRYTSCSNTISRRHHQQIPPAGTTTSRQPQNTPAFPRSCLQQHARTSLPFLPLGTYISITCDGVRHFSYKACGHVCACVFVVHLCVCMCVCACLRVCVSACVCVCSCVYLHVCVGVRLRVCMCACTLKCVCSRVIIREHSSAWKSNTLSTHVVAAAP